MEKEYYQNPLGSLVTRFYIGGWIHQGNRQGGEISSTKEAPLDSFVREKNAP